MRHGSLFSGIGGFDLAAEWMGWENVFHCEWNEFGRKVLKHHFPKSISYENIIETDFTIHRGKIDILTGGFPCQPYSTAGKRKGKDDERHLWPEMLRCIQEVQPRWVVGENVRGIVSWNGGMVFEEVCAEMEAEGYEVQPFILPASGVNAPHQRERVWFVAYRNGKRCNDRSDNREKRQVSHDKERSTKKSESKRSGWECRLGKNGKIGNASDSDSGRTQTRQDRQILAEQNRKGQTGRPIHASIQGNAPDSKCDGLEHSSKSGSIGESKGEARQCLTGHASTESQDGHSTNSNVQRGKWIGKQGEPREKGERREELFSELDDSQYRWQIFPTQSPICGGDDGLSSKLDGITFPKWRAESIKAYGNAIVPQVALQIFKAIEQYEQRTKTKRPASKIVSS